MVALAVTQAMAVRAAQVWTARLSGLRAVLAVTAETPVWRVLVALVPRPALPEPLAMAVTVVLAVMVIPQSQRSPTALLVVPVVTAARPRVVSPVQAAQAVTAEQVSLALTRP
jgi:hypothetical protein